MGLLDSARDKATAAFSSAERDIAERTLEVEQARASLNQIMQAADDRQVADRSAQEAEIKDVELQLKEAQSKLDNDTMVSDVVSKLTDLPLISGPTESIRSSFAAVVAQDQADADQLQAQLSAAKAALATPTSDANAAIDAAKARVDRAESRLSMAQGRQQLAAKAIDTMNAMQEGS